MCRKSVLTIIALLMLTEIVYSGVIMENIQGRKYESLNGEWEVIVDMFSKGEKMQLFLNKTPQGKTDFYEYSYDNGWKLKVPGDWNSQYPELTFYESSVWYRKKIDVVPEKGKRKFVYFAGVNYFATVYLNGVLLGEHEGGFTPFQFEITEHLKDKDNVLIVHANNRRYKDAIPAMIYDWWNYGGITRDVYLVETPLNYIRDFSVNLSKNKYNEISFTVQLDGENVKGETVNISIPELQISSYIKTNQSGYATVTIPSKPSLWSPESPKLYTVLFSTKDDKINDKIGFRHINRIGTEIILNGKPVFLKGINVHEEIPQSVRRAHTKEDAEYIVSSVKELGCNFLRLAHYVQNEHIVRLAEEKGIMMWEEIPIWQDIDFSTPSILSKAERMTKEMISRDKNRCAIIMWSIANETKVSENRNNVLIKLANKTRKIDATRLITASFDNVTFDSANMTFSIDDPLQKEVDVISINKYIGWYMPWPCEPEKIKWEVGIDKPLIFSEFGGESKQGIYGNKDIASSWSEDYQEQLYLQNITMFKQIPNLRGTCPWILFDFRSPYRMHSTYQCGWNRKGLISETGVKKKAWFVMKTYYDSINNQHQYLNFSYK